MFGKIELILQLWPDLQKYYTPSLITKNFIQKYIQCFSRPIFHLQSKNPAVLNPLCFTDDFKNNYI